MDIVDLTHDEQLALAGLAGTAALSDGVVSEGEQREIGLIAGALGDEAYRALLDEVNEKFTNLDELKTFLATITRMEARELIHGILMEEVMSVPTADHSQTELLSWLAATWQISVEIDRNSIS